MKRIAIVTGASSGMGQVFARTARSKVEFDELWVIARRPERLEALKEELKGIVEVVPVPMDLSDRCSIPALKERLSADGVSIELLVNAAGFGKFQAVMDVPEDVAENMIDLNCVALMDMCYACVPYMHEGSKILNIASVAAFQPVPYIAEYAATKAFVLSFSRSLWKELKGKGITVTALCPYWTKTEFFDRAQAGKGDIINYFNAMYNAEDVVARGWRDLLRGKSLSTYGFIARVQIVLVTILPHHFAMWVWCKQQKIKQ